MNRYEKAMKACTPPAELEARLRERVLAAERPKGHVLRPWSLARKAALAAALVAVLTVSVGAVVLVEFCLAYCLEVTVGSPCSFRLACRVFDPRTTHPMLFETTVICATVGLMCPAMSFLAALLYYPYYAGFHVVTLLANWLELVCCNFPFAFFSQLFFIQPLVRTLFRALFRASDAREEKAPA